MKRAVAALSPIAGVLMLTAGAAAAGLPEGAQAWLEQNAVPIVTLDPDAPFDDLQPLKSVFGQARIVQLGEASHGDGTAFSAKVRLIRFLHEELGFNVLAFESGLFECDTANREIRPGADGRTAMRASIFGVWAAEEVVPLFRYLCDQAGTQHPLRLAGFDPQTSGGAARSLVTDLLGFLGPEVTRGIDVQPLETFFALASAQKLKEAAPHHDGAAQCVARLREAFEAHSGQLAERHGARQVDLCSRIVGNLAVWVALKQIRIEEELGVREPDKLGFYTDVRDKQMADNLRWLAEEYYPDERIIVWAHNYHIGHGYRELTRATAAHYENSHPMGEQLKQHFGAQVYTVGFCAYDGYTAWVKRSPTRLPAAGAESLPAALHDLGHAHAFVDLRGEGPLSGLFTCGFMDHYPMEAPWSRSFDGIFFTDWMTPVTAIGDEPFALTVPSVTGDRPLENGGIEEGTGDQPIGWSHTQGAPAGVSYAWDHTVARSGTASLCIANTEGANDQLAMWLQRTREGGSGVYVLSASIRSEGLAEGAAAAVCVQCLDAEGKRVGFATTQAQSAQLVGTKDWTEVSVEVEAPEGTVSFLAFAFLKGMGKVWFDDIRLERK